MVNHIKSVKVFMLDHNMSEMSESEEMYLITIARLVEGGLEEPVPISLLAAELSIQPVSANQMVHKLAEEEFVEYLPYKGVKLTTSGQEAAQQVLRDRRLWEVFLVEHLALPPSIADALVCRLEHITVEGVSDRLAKFLDYPAVSPQGYPIPGVKGETAPDTYQPLSDLAAGEWGEVMRIEGDPITRTFLESEGLRPGVRVISLVIGSGGGMLLAVGESRLQLTKRVTDKVFVNLHKERNKKD